MAFETSTGGAGKTGLLSDKKVNLGSSRLRASVVKLLRDSKQARAAAALLYKDLLHELEANQLDGFTKKPVPMAIENQPCCREEAVEAMILSKLKGMHASAYQRLHAAAQVLSRVVYFHLARLTGDSLNGNNTRPTLLSLENNCPLDCPNRERRFIAGKTARTAAAALSSLVKLRQTGHGRGKEILECRATTHLKYPAHQLLTIYRILFTSRRASCRCREQKIGACCRLCCRFKMSAPLPLFSCLGETTDFTSNALQDLRRKFRDLAPDLSQSGLDDERVEQERNSEAERLLNNCGPQGIFRFLRRGAPAAPRRALWVAALHVNENPFTEVHNSATSHKVSDSRIVQKLLFEESSISATDPNYFPFQTFIVNLAWGFVAGRRHGAV
eukprot:GHVT01000942.1.p1 GENE.GHVT01000942.1~~GHVT01000942.1.p1  ORF type:complete len:386 (+),score=13.41 GHVT01000942.1:1006-2163(+)